MNDFKLPITSSKIPGFKEDAVNIPIFSTNGFAYSRMVDLFHGINPDEDYSISVVNGSKKVAVIDSAAYRRFGNILFAMSRSKRAGHILVLGEDELATDDFRKKMQQILSVVSKGNLMNRLSDMWYEYHVAVMKRGMIEDVRDVSKYNAINASHIVKDNDLYADQYHAGLITKEEFFAKKQKTVQYVRETGFFAGIPCYTSGVLQIEKNVWIIWDILKIDIDEQTMSINCTSYYSTEDKNYDLEMSIPHASFMFQVNYNKDLREDVLPFEVTSIASIPLVNMFQLISPKKFKWTKEERNLWSSVFIKYAKMVDELAEDGDTMMEGIPPLALGMIHIFCEINRILHVSKRKYRSRSSRKEPAEPVAAYDHDKQTGRRWFEIDGVKFYADKRPVEMTRSSVVKYQVASWTVRGHTRTYKNGKTVYIKPRVNHRQCLNELKDSVAPAPKTLNVREAKIPKGK